jgi:hypothetical protein
MDWGLMSDLPIVRFHFKRTPILPTGGADGTA